MFQGFSFVNWYVTDYICEQPLVVLYSSKSKPLGSSAKKSE